MKFKAVESHPRMKKGFIKGGFPLLSPIHTPINKISTYDTIPINKEPKSIYSKYLRFNFEN